MYNPYETPEPGKTGIEFRRVRGAPARKNGIGAVNAGGAIIIIIFVVLCLTIFGILSFATSFADKKLADRNLAGMERYYRADAEAETKLAALYNALRANIAVSPTSGGAFAFDRDFVSRVVSNVTEDAFVYAPHAGGGAVAVVFDTDMGNPPEAEVRFRLRAEVEFYYSAEANRLSHKITEWKVITDSDFTYDGDILDVWIPDFDNWGDLVWG